MRPTDPVLREAVRPARRPLAVVVALGVVGAVLLVVQAWVVTRLVVAAVGGDPVTGWAGLVVTVFALRALAGWGSDVAAARAAVTVGRDVRRRVLAAALAGRAAGSSGAITALATRGAAAAEPYLTRYLPALVLGVVLPVLVVTAIAVADPLSALVVVLTLPLVPVFGALVGSATRDQAESQWRAMADLSGHFLDVVRGLPTLVAFRRAQAQSDTIRAVTDRYRERTLATLRIAFASSAILELVATLSVALVAVTVGLRLATGSLPLTTALVVLLLAPEAYWPLRRVGAEFHAAAEGAATFAQAAAWGSSPGFPSVESRVPEGRVAGSRGAIVADGVAVTYPGRDVPALAPTSLVVPAAGVTAIVGPSGCGKSTLLSVLAGLLEPTEGYVDRPARHEIAVLPQRPVFLAGTLADNLRLARPDATDADLWAALRDVALADRVASLPTGLDTPLGEDGLTLSAGERARLGLARVVLADRPWVLLDEPTAHLDGLTEQVIADTVAALGRSRAVVLVAHRPTLVALADRVVELAAPREPETRPTATRDSTHGNPGLDPREPETRPTGTRGSTGWGSAVIGGLASLFGVALTATAGWLIVQASHEPPVLTLMVAIVGVRAFGIGRPVLRYVERLRSHDTALRLLAERRVAVYDALVPLTPGRLGRRRGDLLASVVDDVDAVLDRELRVRLPIRSFVVVAVLSTAVTTLLSPVAGAVVAVSCLVGGAGTYALARLGSTRAEERAVQGRALVSERVTEAVQTATELRAWQAEGRALAGVDEAGREVGAGTLTSARWLGLARGAVLLTVGLGVAATALLLEGAVGAGELTGPFLALLLLTPLALAEPLTTVTEAGALTARTRAAEARLDALVAAEPAVADPASPVRPGRDTTVAATRIRARWDDREVLAGLDLSLAGGERVAIVGPSGSGKSTLAALLLRFVDPTAGSITLGGVDVRDLRLNDVRARVGLVDDDPHLFASTVAENVRFARPGATDAEVATALRRAHLGDWLDHLPDGLATRLGDGYGRVSGGERARIAIARSLLADQPVLVLDEPTAHLDAATAEAIAAEVLGGVEDGRAVLWITHGSAGRDRVDREILLTAEGGVEQMERLVERQTVSGGVR